MQYFARVIVSPLSPVSLPSRAIFCTAQTVEKVRRKFGFTKRKPSLRGRVARRQPRREGFSPTFAVCVRRRFEPLSLLRRQLPSQGSQTAGNIALSHTRPCRENRKQRHCTDSCRPCVLAEITFSTCCQAFGKACGFQRRRLWSQTAAEKSSLKMWRHRTGMLAVYAVDWHELHVYHGEHLVL